MESALFYFRRGSGIASPAKASRRSLGLFIRPAPRAPRTTRLPEKQYCTKRRCTNHFISKGTGAVAVAGAVALPRHIYLTCTNHKFIHHPFFQAGPSVPVRLTGFCLRAWLPKCASFSIIIIIVIIIVVVVVFDWHLTSSLTSAVTMKATSSLSLP